MKAKCNRCGDTVEVTKLREFKLCKCGAIGLDYGDGDNYYRVVGNPEDFDGAIEGVPIIRFADDSMEKAAKMRDADNPSEEGASVIDMGVTNARMVDTNLNNIATYLEKLSIALEETSDLVSKISRLVMERSDKSEGFKNMMKGE